MTYVLKDCAVEVTAENALAVERPQEQPGHAKPTRPVAMKVNRLMTGQESIANLAPVHEVRGGSLNTSRYRSS